MPSNGRPITIRRANANGRMPLVKRLSIVCDQQPRADPLVWTKKYEPTLAQAIITRKPLLLFFIIYNTSHLYRQRHFIFQLIQSILTIAHYSAMLRFDSRANLEQLFLCLNFNAVIIPHLDQLTNRLCIHTGGGEHLL